MHDRLATTMISFSLLLLSGCAATYYHNWAPQEILAKVDSTLTFEQIKASPDSHTGSTLVLGGEVLEAKRMPDHTRLVILQLPLEENIEPIIDRMQSQGRFLAIEHDFLDPAIVPQGTRLTIIGQISGTHTEPLDEMEYTYPTVTIEHLKVWPKTQEYLYRRYPYRYSPYWYAPYGYNPYWYSPYYFGPY